MALARKTDQVIRKQIGVGEVETIGAELGEEGIVPRFVILAFDFELGHGQRLGELDRFGSRSPGRRQ